MRKLSEINEGFWKDSINRSKNKDKRLEDKFTDAFKKENSLYKVEGFDDYYISLYVKVNVVYAYVYHEPNTEPVEIMNCSWGGRIECPQFVSGGYVLNDDENKDDVVYTEEFANAVDVTLRKMPESEWKK